MTVAGEARALKTVIALVDIIYRLIARYEADAVFTVDERAFVDGIRCELRALGMSERAS